MWMALLPLMQPITCDTADFGGIEIIMCTWSGIRWPSSIRLSFCASKRRRTSPRYGRSWPNRAFRRPFGMNTTWYLHSHREWLRLSNSSIVPRPSVCLAAHASERHDGPPNMSNFCCLPGIAGGLPRFIHVTKIIEGPLRTKHADESHRDKISRHASALTHSDDSAWR